MPGEGPEEDYDEVEEVEEEAPKVRPGQVADERNAALQGKLELCACLPTSSLRVWAGSFQAQTIWRASGFDLCSTAQRALRGQNRGGGGVCQQLSHQVLWSGRRKCSCRLLCPDWLF